MQQAQKECEYLQNGTVDDVVLTVLSGAVARYAEQHGQQIAGRNVRVMVPASLRREEQRGTLGNLVSLLPLDIPLDLSDPRARFQNINAKTRAMKSARAAESFNMLAALMGILPSLRPDITAVYTKTDGIVDWRVCVNDDPASNVEVKSTLATILCMASSHFASAPEFLSSSGDG